MHVKMLIDRLVTVDGVQTVATIAGEIYKMGDGVAHNLIEQGHAEPAEAGTAGPKSARKNDKPTPPAALGASPTALTFTGAAGDELAWQSVSVSGEGKFSVVASDEWLSVDPAEADAPASVTVTVSNELAAGSHSGTVTFEQGDEKVSVAVSASIAAAGEPGAKADEEPLENKASTPKRAASKKTAGKSAGKSATARKK